MDFYTFCRHNLRQPHSSPSVSVLPIHATTTSSHPVNSPLLPSIIFLSRSLPAQDLLLSQIFSSIDFLQAWGLTPGTLWLDRFFWAPRFLWPPYVIRQAIIFLPCGFFFYLSIFYLLFFSPNLSSHRLDVYHNYTHGVALVRIKNVGLKCVARDSLEMNDPKKSPQIRHLGIITHVYRAIFSQLRHLSTIGKNLLNSNTS